MKILLICGSHRRHLYFVNRIQKDFDIAGCLLVQREEILPEVPKNIARLDKNNFIRHFNDRVEAEKKYFGDPVIPKTNVLKITPSNLNSQKSVRFVALINPDIAIIFGSGLVKEPLFSMLPTNTINLHLGLAPRYRGAATLFWPFYFMEPTFAGSTFHFIVKEPDAGAIIHQVVPKLDPNDRIHDVACKTVLKSCEGIVKLLKILKSKGDLKGYKQKGTGKNFLQNDFRPEHLRVIYNVFDNDMVKQYLKGHLNSKKPRLITQY